MTRNKDVMHELSEVNHRLDMIQTVLLVSNPDSPMAADAYNGLRTTIVQSLQATKALQAAIAQLDSVANSTDDMAMVRIKLKELMAQYGVSKLDEYDARPDAFERVGQGATYIVTKPAYVTTREMPPIVHGVAEAGEVSPTTEESADQPLNAGPDSVPDAEQVSQSTSEREGEKE